VGTLDERTIASAATRMAAVCSCSTRLLRAASSYGHWRRKSAPVGCFVPTYAEHGQSCTSRLQVRKTSAS
jgi:hypothetical protein